MNEAVKATIQKIFRNKLILALVLVGIVAAFFSGIKLQDGSSSTSSTTTETVSDSSTNPNAVQPALAVDFVKWWIPKAFDCQPQTATQNHQEASGWMTPQAITSYNNVFWNSQLAKGIMTGIIQAQFTPTGVVALAANPDGSVVVGMTANVQYTNGGVPVNEKLRTDFLITRSTDGLRIAGIYSHPASASTTMTSYATP